MKIIIVDKNTAFWWFVYFADIIFDLAAGDIKYDAKLSDHLMKSPEMHESEEDGYKWARDILIVGCQIVFRFLYKWPYDFCLSDPVMCHRLYVIWEQFLQHLLLL